MRKSILLAVVLQALLISPELQAQASLTGGVFLGLGLNGSSAELDDPDFGGETESGGGFAAKIGYNFTPNIGIFIGAAGAAMESDEADNYTLGHGDLGARYTFMDSTSAFRPYAEAAFSGLSAQSEIEGSDVELSGTGFTGTLGFNYFFTRAFALDISGQYTSGEFNELTIDGEGVSDDDGLEVSTARFNLGLAWYPMRR